MSTQHIFKNDFCTNTLRRRRLHPPKKQSCACDAIGEAASKLYRNFDLAPTKTIFENQAADILDVSLRKLVVASVPEQPREDPRDEPPAKNTAHLAQRQ